MSKLSFRARALDANKSLPVYHAKDIPDLPDIASVNRVVPQMPTGMEKEEETEHHLQRAISAQQIYGEAQRLIIPTPDAILYDADYNKIKKDNVHMPKQFIHVQAFSLEDELPDYDCDEDDIQWVDEYNKNNTQHALTHLEFEKFIDIIEKGCCLRIEMFSLSDCQALLQKDEKLVKEIYDYWKRKRKEQDNIALTPLVRTEKKDGNAFHDPYVAFRRRIEKMQTRKNRKNDEASYEKMLRLRKDLNRACLILEMVKLREQKKRNLLQTTISILEKRYSNRDYNGELLRQCYNLLKQQHYQQQAHQSNDASSHNNNNSSKVPNVERLSRVDSFEERLKKSSQLDDGQRRHKMMKQKSLLHSSSVDGHKSQESNAQANSGQVRLETEVHDGPDGKFTFRRKKDVIYHAPRYDSMGNWPWTHPVEGGTAGSHFCYCYTSVNERKKCVGFARRRVGRGGRSYFDRAYSPYDRNSNSSVFLDTPTTCNNDMPTFQDRVPPWPHFKPNCDLHNSDDSDTNDNNEHKYTWNQWCTTSNTMLHDERKEISSAQKRRRLHSISKLKRLQPYTNRTSLQQFSSSINNQTFLASVSSRYSKSNSPNWLPYKHRKLSQTGDINCSTPTKKTSNILSPPRPASVAPASSIYQLNFPIKIDKSRTKETKSDVPRSSKKSSSKHAKSVPTQPVQTSVVTSVNSTQGSSSVSSQVTASSVAGQQPIISRQPLSIVQQQSYIMQKVVQNHNGGNSLQISAIPTQPMNLVRTGNKLSISRGLNISHAPVSNGMTPSSAGIQLITR